MSFKNFLTSNVNSSEDVKALQDAMHARLIELIGTWVREHGSWESGGPDFEIELNNETNVQKVQEEDGAVMVHVQNQWGQLSKVELITKNWDLKNLLWLYHSISSK